MSARRRRRVGAVVATAAGVVVAGCQVDAQPPPSPRSGLVAVEAPLTEPLWATEHDTLLARAESPARILQLSPSGETLERFATHVDATEGKALVEQPTEVVCIPQPTLGRTVILDTASFDVDGIQNAGRAPVQVVVQPTSKSMLTLSRDHTTVTATDLETHEVLFEASLPSGALTIGSGADTREAAFWTVYPDHVAYYSGDPPRLDARWTGRVDDDTFAPDGDMPGRAYLAEPGSDEVVAVDQPEDGTLETVASATLTDPVAYLESKAKDESRVYAVTSSELAVLASSSLQILAEIDLDRILAEHSLPNADVSGMTVGDEYVYLTLRAVRPRRVAAPIGQRGSAVRRRHPTVPRQQAQRGSSPRCARGVSARARRRPRRGGLGRRPNQGSTRSGGRLRRRMTSTTNPTTTAMPTEIRIGSHWRCVNVSPRTTVTPTQ